MAPHGRLLGEVTGGRRARQIAAVDTETTGLGHNDRLPRDDGVVQVGYAWRNGSGKVIRWHATCNPGAEYLRGGRANDALRVNGLRIETILASPPARTVAVDFRQRLDDISRQSGRELELRSFNRAFDEPFLRARPWNIPSHLWGPCLMQAAQDHLGYWKWPKLHEAVNLLGIEPPDGRSHTAAVDSHSALLIYEALTVGSRR